MVEPITQLDTIASITVHDCAICDFIDILLRGTHLGWRFQGQWPESGSHRV